MNRSLACAVFIAASFGGAASLAADPSGRPEPSRRQMMKECMAKQKASDSGKPKEEMKKNCRDLTKTGRENAAQPDK